MTKLTRLIVLSCSVGSCGAEDLAMPICSTGSGAAVPECGVEFCSPGTMELVANGSEGLRCTGYGAAASCQGNKDYQAFAYKDNNVFLYLSFKPALAAGYSDAAFKANFEYLWMNFYFPKYGTDHTTFYHQTDSLRGLGVFETFGYMDGTLKGRIRVPIKSVMQEIMSRDSACFADDILGRCYCSYPAETEAVLDFDLPVQR